MPFTICTWNINSVRLRAPIVRHLLETEAPDVLCLQETKCPAEKFPAETFAEIGYTHLAVRGDKGYNGVAILSRIPLEDAGRHQGGRLGEVVHSGQRPFEPRRGDYQGLIHDPSASALPDRVSPGVS